MLIYNMLALAQEGAPQNAGYGPRPEYLRRDWDTAGSDRSVTPPSLGDRHPLQPLNMPVLRAQAGRVLWAARPGEITRTRAGHVPSVSAELRVESDGLGFDLTRPISLSDGETAWVTVRPGTDPNPVQPVGSR